MSTDRRLALIAGALYLVTFATSIPALALKEAFLRDGGEPILAQTAALLEIVLAFACVGTAVALYPITRRHEPALALGFVGSRILEGSVILAGVIALLSVMTLRESALATADVESALITFHDWAFLIGPSFMPPINALLLATILYRHRLVPRIIPLLGLIGAPILLVSSVGTVLGLVDQVSTYAGALALPIAAWEFAIGAWLIVKGTGKAGSEHVADTAH